MFKTLKTIAVELKRANDLKERDIKNKDTWMWYSRPSAVTSADDNINYSNAHYGWSTTTAGGR